MNISFDFICMVSFVAVLLLILTYFLIILNVQYPCRQPYDRLWFDDPLSISCILTSVLSSAVYLLAIIHLCMEYFLVSSLLATLFISWFLCLLWSIIVCSGNFWQNELGTLTECKYACCCWNAYQTTPITAR